MDSLSFYCKFLKFLGFFFLFAAALDEIAFFAMWSTGSGGLDLHALGSPLSSWSAYVFIWQLVAPSLGIVFLGWAFNCFVIRGVLLAFISITANTKSTVDILRDIRNDLAARLPERRKEHGLNSPWAETVIGRARRDAGKR